MKTATVAVLWFLVIAPVIPPLIETWFSHSDNSHAVLVPFISLYFALTKREELASTPKTGSFWGAIFLTLFLVLFLLS